MGIIYFVVYQLNYMPPKKDRVSISIRLPEGEVNKIDKVIEDSNEFADRVDFVKKAIYWYLNQDEHYKKMKSNMIDILRNDPDVSNTVSEITVKGVIEKLQKMS